MKELTINQKAHNSRISEFFKKIPWDRIKQEEGGQNTECGCCVGAWLCVFYERHPGDYYDEGAQQWARNMGYRSYGFNDSGGNYRIRYAYEQAQELLIKAGAGPSPWSSIPWKEHPSIVFERLSQ